MLSLAGVHVSIGHIAIRHGINLDVHTSESAGLIGRSGAGNTTLARTIIGLPSTSGRLDFEQKPSVGS
ncbi:MAG: ATP-binding cassette domain-containing protein [Hyphomicrobiaceae bacterium]|nr:ATP-binding cassette domain-containing protein [Hyphomicrobiaceae bacterium]